MRKSWFYIGPAVLLLLVGGTYSVFDAVRYHYFGSALHRAVRSGDLKAVQARLRWGGDINERMPDWHKTPLFVAVEYDHADIAALLLEHGANPNIPDVYARTPLLWAIEKLPPSDNLSLVRILIEHHADPNIPDSAHRTPLALARGNQALESSLLKHGAR